MGKSRYKQRKTNRDALDTYLKGVSESTDTLESPVSEVRGTQITDDLGQGDGLLPITETKPLERKETKLPSKDKRPAWMTDEILARDLNKDFFPFPEGTIESLTQPRIEPASTTKQPETRIEDVQMQKPFEMNPNLAKLDPVVQLYQLLEAAKIKPLDQPEPDERPGVQKGLERWMEAPREGLALIYEGMRQSQGGVKSLFRETGYNANDIARGFGKKVLGTINFGINMLPGVQGLNLSMPTIEDMSGKVGKDIGIGEDAGKTLSHLIAPFIFGKYVGLGSLASQGIDAAMQDKDLMETFGVLDPKIKLAVDAYNSMNAADQQLARELISNTAFFTIAGFGPKAERIYGEYINKSYDNAFPDQSYDVKPIDPSARILPEKFTRTQQKIFEAYENMKGREPGEKKVFEEKVSTFAPTFEEALNKAEKIKPETIESLVPVKKEVSPLTSKTAATKPEEVIKPPAAIKQPEKIEDLVPEEPKLTEKQQKEVDEAEIPAGIKKWMKTVEEQKSYTPTKSIEHKKINGIDVLKETRKDPNSAGDVELFYLDKNTNDTPFIDQYSDIETFDKKLDFTMQASTLWSLRHQRDTGEIINDVSVETSKTEGEVKWAIDKANEILNPEESKKYIARLKREWKKKGNSVEFFTEKQQKEVDETEKLDNTYADVQKTLSDLNNLEYTAEQGNIIENLNAYRKDLNNKILKLKRGEKVTEKQIKYALDGIKEYQGQAKDYLSTPQKAEAEKPKSQFAALTDAELDKKYSEVQKRLLAAGTLDLPPGIDVRSPVDKALFEQIKAEQLSRKSKEEPEIIRQNLVTGEKDVIPITEKKDYSKGLDKKGKEVFEVPFKDKTPVAANEVLGLLTGGLPSAGKSAAKNNLEGDITDRVGIDSDATKALLPGTAPEEHELSSDIAKRQLDRVLDENYKFIYDSQLTNYPLAKEIIENVLGKDGNIHIGFINISPETSRIRSVARFIVGESGRFIPADAIVKGHNRAAPTFMKLYEEYKENPDVDFELYDAEEKFVNTKLVMENLDAKEAIHIKKLFDSFSNISYIDVAKGKELRYELTDKYTTGQLEAAEKEILEGIREALDQKGISKQLSEIQEIINREEAKARGEDLEDVIIKPEPKGPIEGEQPTGIQQPEGSGAVGELGAGEGAGSEPADRGIDQSGISPDRGEGSGTPRVQLNKANHRIKQKQLNESSFTFTTRYADNVAAIKTLKDILKKKRKATKKEQEVLSKFVGWGGLSKVFDYHHTSVDQQKYGKLKEELEELLTEDEYRAAAASTTNAFFTSPTVINSIWKMAAKLGFKGGRILEPGMGVGSFYGLMPKEISDRSFLEGIELDDISAQIASLLYPDAVINEGEPAGKGYQEIYLPSNSFDLVISNVPFANVNIFDETEPNSEWSKNKLPLHNFYIMKSIDKIKPGGLLAIVTSHFTMDAQSDAFRRTILKEADLVTAYKLPNNAFKGVAGTEVTTDILIFRKKDEDVPFPDELKSEWLESEKTDLDGEKVSINKYFLDNPKNIFGKLSAKGTMYGPKAELTVESDGKLDEHIRKALSRLKGDAFTATPESKAGKIKTAADRLRIKKRNAGNYVVKKNKIYKVDEEGELQAADKIDKKQVDRFKDMGDLRDTVLDFYKEQQSNPDDKLINDMLGNVVQKYNTFVKKHGQLNTPANKKFFADDPDYSRLRALEIYDDEKKKFEKSGMLKGRVFQPFKPPDKAESSSEALAITLSEKGKIDFDFAAKLVNKPKDQVIDELANSGDIFLNNSGNYETRDKYLSGNVVQKLREAESLAAKDERYKPNVEALKGVQPLPVTYSEIETKLGAGFVPPEVYESFLQDLFNVPGMNVNVKNLTVGDRNKWFFDIPNKWDIEQGVESTTKYGTPEFSGLELFQKAMNNLKPVVTIRYSDGTSKIDQDATAAAQDKLQLIKDAWKSWIIKNKENRDAVEQRYNELFNTSARRKFSGEHLKLPGVANIVDGREYKYRGYQYDFIWRMIQNRNNLADHAVGSGKTGTLVAGIMERIRLGITEKAVYVTKKALVQQVKDEAQALYPQANILMPEPNDFQKANRPALLNRIKTHDWDIVILSNENFKNLELAPNTQMGFLLEKFAELELALQAEIASQEGGRRKSQSQKELEKKKQRLAEKIKEKEALIKAGRKSTAKQVDYFDQLGVDYLVVDESHNYKNLYSPTGRGRVKGIGTTESQRAFDLSIKMWWMNQQERGGVTFATGTPISNALTEFYTIQKYLQPQKLKDLGIYSLDSWLDTFSEEQTKLELTPEGKGMRPSTRVSKLVNLPELMKIYAEVTDIIKREDVEKHVSLPKIKGGEREIIKIDASEEQLAYYESLAARAKKLKTGRVDPKVDNFLNITTDGRKAALDMRLIDPKAKDYPDNKINQGVEHIYDIWKGNKKDPTKLVQLVFLDMGTPTGTAKVNLYQDMKDKLVKKGIPKAEIAFVHDAKNRKQLDALYKRVNEAKIRVFIGSTAKLSEGVNIQKKLFTLHDMNPPYKPSELEQREGRIIRWGNENEEIRVLRYITSGRGDVAGYDAYMYQLLENKVKGISQASNVDTTVRSVEEAEQRALTYAEIKALATGNPLIMEKIQVEQDVINLTRQRNEHTLTQQDIRSEIAGLPQRVIKEKEKVDKSQAILSDLPKDKTITFILGNKKIYDLSDEKLKKEAGQELLRIADDLAAKKVKKSVRVVDYGNIEVNFIYSSIIDETKITLLLKIKDATDLEFGYNKYYDISAVGGVNINRILAYPEDIKTISSEYENQLKASKTRLSRLKEEATGKFPKEADYQTAIKRLNEINKSLDTDKADVVDEEAGPEVEGRAEAIEPDEGEVLEAGKSKLYEALRDKDLYNVNELAKDLPAKDKKDIANALNDLAKQRLVTRSDKGFVPTEEFKILLNDINENPEKYEDDFSKLYSNPLPAMLKGIGRLQNFIDDVWQNAVGDRVFKAAGKAVNFLTPEKLKEIVVTNYGLPAEYLSIRREAFDAIQRYNELAGEIADALTFRRKETKQKFTDAEQKRIAQIIKGSVSHQPELRERANKAIKEIKELENLGKELETLPIETYNTKLPRKRINELLTEKAKIVEQREQMLDKIKEKPDKETGIDEVAEKAKKRISSKYDRKIKDLETKVKNSFVHGGEGYFKRVYTSKEQTKLLKKYGYIKPTRLDLTSAMHRKDIPFEVRQKMGEILTAAYPAAKGIMLEGKDVSFGRFFEVISENPDWASEDEIAGWVKLPKDKKLGKLSELYVEPHIAGDINDVMKLTDTDEVDKFLKKINGIWKATKTVMNPATHLRNVYSNSIFLDFSGVPHVDQARILPKAIGAIKGTGEYAKEFKASRLNSTTFQAAELGQYLDAVAQDRGFMDLSLAQKITKLYGKVSLVDTKLGKFMGKVYQMEEVLGKAIKFIHEREKGKSINEARAQANKWLFDYSEIPKLVRYLRTNPIFGVPFITWSYKAFPRILEAAMTRPVSFWKYPVIFSAIAAAALAALGITEEEWAEINKTLPVRMLKGEWLLLPFRDDAGKLQMLDLTYILPYKDVYDVTTSGISLVQSGKFNSDDDVVEGVLGLIQAPIFKTAAELMANKNTYSNSEIWLEVDSPLEKAQKVFDYTYKAFMPSLAPEIPMLSKGGYAYHKLRSTISNREDYYGRTFTLGPAIGSSLLGLKTSPVEPAKNIERYKAKQTRFLQQLGTKKNRILRDGALTEQERVDKAAEIDAQMDEIREGIESLRIPTKRDDVKQLESQIRSLQRQLSQLPTSRTKARKLLQEKISRKKIELDKMMNEDPFTGEFETGEDKKKSTKKSLKTSTKTSLKKPL